MTLNLGDKEFVLAAGTKEDADKIWAVLKDQATPVPGTVIEAPASAIKVRGDTGSQADRLSRQAANPRDVQGFPGAGRPI